MSDHAWLGYTGDSWRVRCVRCGAERWPVEGGLAYRANGRIMPTLEEPPCLEGLWDALIDHARRET